MAEVIQPFRGRARTSSQSSRLGSAQVSSQDKLLRAEAVEDIIQLRQSRVSELGTGLSGP